MTVAPDQPDPNDPDVHPDGAPEVPEPDLDPVEPVTVPEEDDPRGPVAPVAPH